MNNLRKINFRQGKYIFPLILYPILLFAGYQFIDLFQTKKAEIPDSEMQTTEYLNPNLPQPKVKDDIGGKMENVKRSFGLIDDFTAVDNIEREDKDAEKEKYDSRYSDDERQVVTDAQERDREMEEQLRRSAGRAAALQQQSELPTSI